MNGQDKREGRQKWDLFDGFLFPLASSMPHWQVQCYLGTDLHPNKLYGEGEATSSRSSFIPDHTQLQLEPLT